MDLDTFFVSVKRLHDPSLVGKPVVVGGARGGRGVVTAASYEVRAFGVRSGMPLKEASRLAPKEAVFVSTRHSDYGAYSEKGKCIVERYSPIVRAASIDEFFIDFKGCERMHHMPGDADEDETIQRMVHRMREAIEDELGLPASAGLALSNLGLFEAQLELPFHQKLCAERLHRAVDAIRERYGFEAVNLASSKSRRRS